MRRKTDVVRVSMRPTACAAQSRRWRACAARAQCSTTAWRMPRAILHSTRARSAAIAGGWVLPYLRCLSPACGCIRPCGHVTGAPSGADCAAAGTDRLPSYCPRLPGPNVIACTTRGYSGPSSVQLQPHGPTHGRLRPPHLPTIVIITTDTICIFITFSNPDYLDFFLLTFFKGVNYIIFSRKPMIMSIREIILYFLA